MAIKSFVGFLIIINKTMEIKNKQQAEEFLREAKANISEVENWLKNNSDNKLKRMEELFLKLVNDNLRVVINKEEQTVTYYNSENNWIMQQDIKNKEFWFSYSKFWIKFETEFGLKYEEIRDFLNTMVSKHFNLKGYTTLIHHVHGILR